MIDVEAMASERRSTQIDMDIEGMAAMTDADGMDYPPATGSTWERGDYYGEDRRRPVPTRTQLEAEVGRHKEKLRRAEEKLAALENIPEQDPYPNGTVLYFRRGPYTFAALRANAFWYTTGRKEGVSRVPWTQFVDWMLTGRVDVIHEMTKGQAIRFGAAAALPVQQCERHDGPHKPHRIPGSMAWCDGSEGFGGTLTLLQSLMEGSPAPDLACTVSSIHPAHVWVENQHYPEGTDGPWRRVRCPGVSILGPNPVGVAGLIDMIKTNPNRKPVIDPPEAYAGPDGMPTPSLREQNLAAQVAGNEERIRLLTEQVGLWRSVVSNPVEDASGAFTRPCAIDNTHPGHRWFAEGGALVVCPGQSGGLKGAPEKQG